MPLTIAQRSSAPQESASRSTIGQPGEWRRIESNPVAATSTILGDQLSIEIELHGKARRTYRAKQWKQKRLILRERKRQQMQDQQCSNHRPATPEMPTTTSNQGQENRPRDQCNIQSNGNSQGDNQEQPIPNQPPEEAPPRVLSASQRLLLEEENNPNHPLSRLPLRHHPREQFSRLSDRIPEVRPTSPTKPRTDDLDLTDPIDRQILHRRTQLIHPIVPRPIQMEFDEIYQSLNWISDAQFLIHAHAHGSVTWHDPNVPPSAQHSITTPQPPGPHGPNIPDGELMTLMNGITRMNGEELYDISKYMKDSLSLAVSRVRTKISKRIEANNAMDFHYRNKMRQRRIEEYARHQRRSKRNVRCKSPTPDWKHHRSSSRSPSPPKCPTQATRTNLRPLVCMITTQNSKETPQPMLRTAQCSSEKSIDRHTIPEVPYPRSLQDSPESYPIVYGKEFQPFLQGELPTCNLCRDSMHQETECQYHQIQLRQPDVDLESYKGSYRECRLCKAPGHGAYDCNWRKYGSNHMLDRIKSLNGNPPPVSIEIYPIDNDIQDVIGNPLDNFWVAKTRQLSSKKQT